MLLGVLSGFIVRFGFLFYGAWQDSVMAVKYTDVDYRVFCDAARFVQQGDSPYNRSTYRYTPLIAWILVPGLYLGESFGKLLFVLFDVATGVLIHLLVRQQTRCERSAQLSAWIWYLNPLTAAISTRGNSDSLMTLLTLSSLYSLLTRRVVLSSALLTLSVHVKIYPISYSLPAYLYLTPELSSRLIEKSTKTSPRLRTAFVRLKPNYLRFQLVVTFLVTLSVLTAIFYYLYGWEFIQHSYLYHVSRMDSRHNFSPFFYMLYLTSDCAISNILSRAIFVPQVFVLLALSWRYYDDPVLCFFLHTFVFVTFNKVCTSQYFVWYLCYVPVLLPNLSLNGFEKARLAASWGFGQGLWLFFAYLLEFKGHNTFLYIWFAGLVFFLINIRVMTRIARSYKQAEHEKTR